MTMSALHVLKIDDKIRKRAADCLTPPSKIKVRLSCILAVFHAQHGLCIQQDILYFIVIANGRVVTVARPKKHSIHPSGDDGVLYL
jgi:vacuolar fusion protein MON1